MLRGFWKLTWLEIKIFVREPLGVLGSVVIPVAMFLVLGRALGSRSGNSDTASRLLSQDLPFSLLSLSLWERRCRWLPS